MARRSWPLRGAVWTIRGGCFLTCVGFLLGCPDGAVRARPRPGDHPVAAQPPKRIWEGLAELDKMTVVAELPSSHPVGELVATVRVDASGSSYATRGRAPMPVGAMIVESLAIDATGPAHLHYVMRRREPGYFVDGGDWEYLVIGQDGRVEAEGRLPLCARCHAEAPREHLFEIGRNNAPAPAP